MASQPLSSLWVTGEENGFPRPFGNYLLLAAFAQGGMGELFLAMNGSIAGAFRLCVVKKLRADLTNDKEYVNRFIDEAKVVVQLNHANISHVFDIGRIDGHYYLAMEYVSGVSVKRLMSRAAELDAIIPEEIGVLIAREVLEALDYAHLHTHPISGEALNVVHRDVSPQNVLVSWAGEVKLIDFGLALSAMKDEHTATGAVMGKVAYMPPEQARGEEVGPACDQFATAIVTYEMLAGDRYHGDLPMHAIWAIAGMGNFPPPKWNKLPRELQIILQRALHNDPYRRYPTCGDLREALGAYMAAHHPATSGRHLRDLLEKWFKEYRAEERELLAQFKDVTGTKIREAVKGTTTAVESLVSGTHQRPVGWQMPPAAPDARAVEPSGPVTAPAALDLGLASSKIPEGRLDESRSMRLMPPPANGQSGATAASAAALVDAAAALLAPVVPPPASQALPPPSLTPLTPLATVAESTAQFLRAPGAASTPVGALAPRATFGESTERVVREQGSAGYPVLVPLSQALPQNPPPQEVLSPPASVVAAAAVAGAAPTAATSGAVSTAAASGSRASSSDSPAAGSRRAPMDRHEPTERLRKPAADDDLDFDPARRPMWPFAAAAVAAVAAIVIAIVASSGDPAPVTPPIATGTGTGTTGTPGTGTPGTGTTGTPGTGDMGATGATNGTATSGTPTNGTTTTNGGTIAGGTKPIIKTPKDKPPKDKPIVVTKVDPPVDPPIDTPIETEARDVARARERVDALRRSACKDDCVGRIVGQLETMPNALQLEGFRSSVSTCVDLCRK